MTSEELIRIATEYRPMGILKGFELLLPPEIIVSYIEDLAKAGILIYGCDFWRFLDPSKDPKRIVALLGAGLDITRDLKLEKPPSIKQSAGMVKKFIKDHLPDDADLVSLTTKGNEMEKVFGLGKY